MNRTTLLCLFFLPALLNAQEFAQLNEAGMADLFNNPMYNNPEEDRVRPPEEVQRIIDLRTEAALEKLKKQNTQRHLLAGLTLTGLGALTFYQNRNPIISDALFFFGLGFCASRTKSENLFTTFNGLSCGYGIKYCEKYVKKKILTPSLPHFNSLLTGSLIEKYNPSAIALGILQIRMMFDYSLHNRKEDFFSGLISRELLCYKVNQSIPHFPFTAFIITEIVHTAYESYMMPLQPID